MLAAMPDLPPILMPPILMPPILITGAGGLLGNALRELCLELGLPFRAYTRAELDITDPAAVEAKLAEFAAEVMDAKPTVSPRAPVEPSPGTVSRGLVINAAAFADVDEAERQEERAFAVNAAAAANLAAAAARHHLDFLHLSTDYVFDGAKTTPYTESDEPRPLNAYGRSKLAGEELVTQAHPTPLIVRTSWLYGPGGSNFPARIAARARQILASSGPRRLEISPEQTSSPTSAADLARGLLELYRRGARGLFHLAGSGSCSRSELAREVLSAAGLPVEVGTTEAAAPSKVAPTAAARPSEVPTTGAAGPTEGPTRETAQPSIRAGAAASARAPGLTRALRPRYSVLDCSKSAAWGVELPPWRVSLRAYVKGYLVEAET